jgi:hypothetical protein
MNALMSAGVQLMIFSLSSKATSRFMAPSIACSRGRGGCGRGGGREVRVGRGGRGGKVGGSEERGEAVTSDGITQGALGLAIKLTAGIVCLYTLHDALLSRFCWTIGASLTLAPIRQKAP